MKTTVALPDHLAEIAEQLLRARVQGASERSLARPFGISTQEVREAVSSMIPTLDANARRAELALELLRLDELVAVFHQKARAGCAISASICIRLSERRGVLMGLETRPVDVAIVNVAPTPRPNNVEAVRAAIARVCAERPVATGPALIEATAAPADSGTDTKH